MAKISIIKWPGGHPRIIYSVETAVGKSAINNRNDVLLVQYFLREIFKGLPAFKTDPFPGGELIVDGKCGPQTIAAILHFQKVAQKKEFATSQDGRVDPPVGEKHFGSISQTQYTIITMNVAFKKARPQDWPRVSKTGDCPMELRQPLSEPQFI